MAAKDIQYSIEELAKELGATFCGNKDHLIAAVADLETASSTDVSFFHNEKYRQALQRSSAGLVIASSVDPEAAVHNWLIHENPSLAFQKAIELFCKKLDTMPYQGIHPSAVIDPSAKLSPGVTLSPGCIIGPRCQIGSHTYIGPGSILGSDVIIGEKCVIHAKVVIRESCTLGHRVILQPGVVIGSCGFGYNTHQGQHIKLEQLGSVVIEDDVEIGANTCIDRARFKETKIGRGSKIDNLVMIAHGVEVGEDNLIVAQTGIAGSSKTGRWVVLGGQVGVAGHLEIGKGTQVAAQSGVSKNLISGVYGGTPAHPIRQWHESLAHIQSIGRLKKKLQMLEEKIERLENN